MTKTALYALVMFLAGVGIPIMATLNARLGGASTPIHAAFILAVVATAVLGVALALTGPGPRALPQLPAIYYCGGILFVGYILAATWVIPHFGVANAIFFVLIGQLVASALIDHLGAFGAAPTPLDLKRVTGLAVMALGVFIALK